MSQPGHHRKANFVLCTFKSADPFVKCFFIKAYCLSLYDCTLWSLSCKSLHVIQVAINNVFRKVWNLPFKSHTAIVHCVARIFPICNLIFPILMLYHTPQLLSSQPFYPPLPSFTHFLVTTICLGTNI